MPSTHELKTWPDSFQALIDGTKTHELRPADRSFEVGDILFLREFSPCPTCRATGRVWDNGDTTDCHACWIPMAGAPGGGFNTRGVYTGRTLYMQVTYVTPPGKFGLDEHHCVMSVRRHIAL